MMFLVAALIWTVHPAAAAMTLKLDQVVPDKLYDTWPSIGDGHVTQLGAGGNYAAQYTWGSPPASMDANGFTLSMNVVAQGPRSNIAAGISVSSYDFNFDKDPSGVSVYADVGQSKSASISVKVKPDPYSADGSTVELRIGADYGPGVTYRYKVSNPPTGGNGGVAGGSGTDNGTLAASIDDCIPGTMITISALPSLNCHITITSWIHNVSDPVEVIFPAELDTFGNHMNGIQVMGEGEADPYNWDAPYSWGLFVFACPAQQGTGANCYNSMTTPGPVSVPIVVRQGAAMVNLSLDLTAIPHAGSPGNPPIAGGIPIPPLGHSGPGNLNATLDCPPEITISALPSLNCHILITGWRHNTSDPVEVILPQAIDTFGNHANGIQVLGRGENDVFNWVDPSFSWGLFVFACPSQQGTGQIAIIA